MQKITEAVTVFYSSTDDVEASVRLASVRKVANMIEGLAQVAIPVIYWKDSISTGVAGKDGQARIDKAVRGAYDIYFGCMGTKYGKGTVIEFRKAIKSHIEDGSPAEVLFAFDETPRNPYAVADDFIDVKRFRNSLQSSKAHRRAILYFAFKSMDEFERYLLRDLHEAVKKSRSRIFGGGLPLP